ncbi:hypothetical protein MHYP_G00133150 [Metynnis hypsauchen]
MFSTRPIFIILTVLHSLSGQKYNVPQYPSDLFINPGENHELNCNHSIPSYDMILWYQQSIGDTSLKLIAYVYYTNAKTESSFEGRFNVSGDGAKHSTLHLLKLRAAEDSAVYYCAAKEAQWVQVPSLFYKKLY